MFDRTGRGKGMGWWGCGGLVLALVGDDTISGKDGNELDAINRVPTKLGDDTISGSAAMNWTRFIASRRDLRVLGRTAALALVP